MSSIVLIVLAAVFLIVPLIYLVNRFDVVYEDRALKRNPIVQPFGVNLSFSEHLPHYILV